MEGFRQELCQHSLPVCLFLALLAGKRLACCLQLQARLAVYSRQAFRPAMMKDIRPSEAANLEPGIRQPCRPDQLSLALPGAEDNRPEESLPADNCPANPDNQMGATPDNRLMDSFPMAENQAVRDNRKKAADLDNWIPDIPIPGIRLVGLSGLNPDSQSLTLCGFLPDNSNPDILNLAVCRHSPAAADFDYTRMLIDPDSCFPDSLGSRTKRLMSAAPDILGFGIFPLALAGFVF